MDPAKLPRQDGQAPSKSRETSDRHLVASLSCHAAETFMIRSTASFKLATDEANEKRTKSFPDGPKAAPGIAATPPSSSSIRHTSSALVPVAVTSTQA